MIGYPLLLDSSAHGLYAKQDSFVDKDYVMKWIDNMETHNIPYNGISLPYVAH
jgi:hypothetical protein